MDTQPELMRAAEALKTGKRDEARQVLDELVTSDPDNADAWGMLFWAVDDPREKHDCLKQVVRVRPTDVKAWQKLKKYESGAEYRDAIAAQSLERRQREKNVRDAYKRKERLKRWLSSLLEDEES
jgi:predicted Zn-dependent protease